MMDVVPGSESQSYGWVHGTASGYAAVPPAPGTIPTPTSSPTFIPCLHSMDQLGSEEPTLLALTSGGGTLHGEDDFQVLARARVPGCSM